MPTGGHYMECEECGERYQGWERCPFCGGAGSAAPIMTMDGAFEEAWDALRKAWYDEPETEEALMNEDPELHARRNKFPEDDDPFWDHMAELDDADIQEGASPDAKREAEEAEGNVLSRLFPSKKPLGARGKEGINAILNLLGLRRPQQ